ncbi:hypothetical protein ACWC2T_33710 [Streptomyces sp. NPDC001393]
MVPLAEAWRSGADTWNADQRKAFGNDLKDPQLLIASESANSSKSDSGWADRKPKPAFWHTHAEDCTHIKSVGKPTTTDKDEDSDACGASTISEKAARPGIHRRSGHSSASTSRPSRSALHPDPAVRLGAGAGTGRRLITQANSPYGSIVEQQCRTLC